jgi:hypothetical protein
LAAVITQNNRPFAFFSWKLSKTQRKHSVKKIELMAIVETLIEFKGMLWEQSIKVYTDQHNLIRNALALTPTEYTIVGYCWKIMLPEKSLSKRFIIQLLTLFHN